MVLDTYTYRQTLPTRVGVQINLKLLTCFFTFMKNARVLMLTRSNAQTSIFTGHAQWPNGQTVKWSNGQMVEWCT